MEDLKEMFAQMMKFQMEYQQKNEEKQQVQKENEERILKNEEKQQQFFLELLKQQEALFKSLSNDQPTDSTTIFYSKCSVGRTRNIFLRTRWG